MASSAPISHVTARGPPRRTPALSPSCSRRRPARGSAAGRRSGPGSSTRRRAACRRCPRRRSLSPAGSPSLPAAGEWDRGHAQTKLRCVAITELGVRVVGAASPEPHHRVTASRTVARRANRCLRGRARPALATDLAAALRSPPGTAAQPGRGGRPLLSPGSARRSRSGTAGDMAVLFDAGLRYDDSDSRGGSLATSSSSRMGSTCPSSARRDRRISCCWDRRPRCPPPPPWGRPGGRHLGPAVENCRR